MKKRIVSGLGLALVLGGTFASIYGRGEGGMMLDPEIQPGPSPEASAATLAMWKARAASPDCTAPKLPL